MPDASFLLFQTRSGRDVLRFGSGTSLDLDAHMLLLDQLWSKLF